METDLADSITSGKRTQVPLSALTEFHSHAAADRARPTAAIRLGNLGNTGTRPRGDGRRKCVDRPRGDVRFCRDEQGLRGSFP